MAQIQSRVLDLGQVMGIYAPFFQRQAEKQKATEEKLIALGTLEDIANSAPVGSKTYQEYQQVMQDMLNYSADISRGDHIPGYNAERTANLFRNYGKVTGRINRINKEIEDSRTRRTTYLAQHPTAIFKQNSVSDNIDELADGKRINDEFTDNETITKIMQTQAGYIGKALDNFARYSSIDATKGFSIEVLQHGGIKPAILNDIWKYGYSDKCDATTNEIIKQFIDQAKKSIGYSQFDSIGRQQIDNVALNALTAALQEDKVNVIDSGEGERQKIQIQRAAQHLDEAKFDYAKSKDEGGGSTNHNTERHPSKPRRPKRGGNNTSNRNNNTSRRRYNNSGRNGGTSRSTNSTRVVNNRPASTPSTSSGGSNGGGGGTRTLPPGA